MQLSQGNISEAVADSVRAMIVGGDLGAGERINEVHLAANLGVSRTPLREALSGLVSEGALIARPRQGYFVRPFTLEELQQIYSVRPILDPAALRLAGIPATKRIDDLERLNGKLAVARDPRKIVALDDEWHLKLLADCPNRILIEFIQNIIWRSRRYELALFRETKDVLRAGEDHARIIAALRASDLDAACGALKRNMESGLPPLVAWLKGREAETKRKRR